MRIAIGLEYDGSGFDGWQSQPGGNTVQDIVEQALAQIACHPVRTICAGRTDAGVHATAQVVHFDTCAARSDHAWVRGTNAHLRPGVAVRWARSVGDDFHARFSARSRTYRYLLLNRPQRPGLWSGKVGWYHGALDLEGMSRAAAALVGEHDFSAFRAAECQARSPVRHLYESRLERYGDLIVFAFRANAFLHHMVRNVVGGLVYVGSGRIDVETFRGILQAKDRRRAPPTFAADGLYLAAVEYASGLGLPAENGIMPVPVLAV